MVAGRRHPGAGQRGLDGRRHRSPGRDQGVHLAPLLHQRVGHRHHDLAVEAGRQRPDGGDHGVPGRGHHHDVGGPPASSLAAPTMASWRGQASCSDATTSAAASLVA